MSSPSATSTSVRLPAHGIDWNLSSSESQTTSQSNEEVHVLQRHICALEVENTLIHSKICKKPIQTLSREGRAVQWLITLVEPISDMIAEYDRCQLCLREDGVTLATIQAESTLDQHCTFKNYQKLVNWCPTVAKLLDLGEFNLYACWEVQVGADGARGDDASSLKGEIIQWIATGVSYVDPPLSTHNKDGCVLNHMLTGCLLCPVDYDWADTSVRAGIREYHPKFQVMAYSWPLFLYRDYMSNPNLPLQGLFQSDLLVKGFKHIFTSPTSARHHDKGDNSFWRKVSRARTNVAELLQMRTVQPWAIAYIAVQLRFALSSATSWAVVDDDFNYETFYYHIIEYFEAPDSPDKTAEISALLLWWNRNVFSRQNVSEYHPLCSEFLSVARSCK